MSDENARPGASADLGTVRDALRAELSSRGYRVASDTLGLRRELYVMGADDLARALFEFNDDAEDAADLMYRSSGSWVKGMPPRFAVLPTSASESPGMEMLEQMRAIPLHFEVDGGRVSFRDLDRLLVEHIPA